MKYASWKTIKRLSRREVEDAIEDRLIELPVIDRKLPCWWEDSYDPLLTDAEGLTEAEYYAAREQRRTEWTAEQAEDNEHPAARETLLKDGIRRAVSKAGLDELNKIIREHLADKNRMPFTGLQPWSAWMLRVNPRSDREKAVFEYLMAKEMAETQKEKVAR